MTEALEKAEITLGNYREAPEDGSSPIIHRQFDSGSSALIDR